MDPRLKRTLLLVSGGIVAVAIHRAAMVGQGYGLEDEGFLHLLSMAFADGASLYDRFHLLYPPGQYVWFGSWLALLGDGVGVLRLAMAVLGGIVAVALAAVLWRPCGPVLAGTSGAAVALSATGNTVTAGAVAVLAAALAVGSEVPPKLRTVAGVALAAGLAAGWREDAAVLLAAAAGVGVLRRQRLHEVVTVLLPAATVGFLPWLLVFSLRGDGWDLIGHVVRRFAFLVLRLDDPAVAGITRWSGEPIASPRDLAVLVFPIVSWIPPLLYAGILAHAGWQRWRGHHSWWRPASVGALVGLAFVPYYLWERPDIWHLRNHLPVFVAVCAVVACELAPPWRRVAVMVLVCGGALSHGALWAQHMRTAETAYPTESARRLGIRLEGSLPPWAGAIEASSGQLLVLPLGPGWYLAEGVRPPTKILHASPRILALLNAERQLQATLTDPELLWVITIGRSVESGVEVPAEVRAVLEAEFAPVAQWQKWWLWQRRCTIAPAAFTIWNRVSRGDTLSPACRRRRRRPSSPRDIWSRRCHGANIRRLCTQP